jgi:predicted metal-dependent hydrolase
MASERKFFLNDAGEIIIRKRRNARRLSIRINRNAQVTVTVPLIVSYRDAEQFILSRKDWIVRTRRKVLLEAVPEIVYGEGEILKTSHHRILVQRSRNSTVNFRINKMHTVVNIPAGADLQAKAVQDLIRRAITETLRREAREYLVPRVSQLAVKYGFTYNRVTVKNLKSRWGSCSSLNNINLNIHLMRLPDRLSDYVILHELTHTRHHNHSKAFWDELAKYVAEPSKVARELRKFRTDIL